jgi:signal transduction histidine kinase/ligand-binding sensor domain-containing protein
MGRFPRFVLLLCLSTAVLGADHSNITPTHSHTIWDAAAGFPGGYVYAISQTTDGYLWIGTSKGLVRYDGLSFVTIRQSDSSGEARIPVLGLVSDANDQLWLTDDHTHLFQYAGSHLIGPLSDKDQHLYGTVLIDKTREGWLLLTSELHGMIEYKQGTPHLLLDSSKIPSNTTAAVQTQDGAFWLGTSGSGLYRVSLVGSSPQIQRIAGLPNIRINCLLPIDSSSLLIGTEKGLFTFHNGTLIQESTSELNNRPIFVLSNGQDGAIWIGTDGHVFKAHERDIETDGKIHSLERLPVHTTPTSLFEDRDGNLWIGEPEAIERYRDTGFTTYQSSAGLPCTNCGAIYADHQGGTWFAPWDGKLFRLAQGEIESVEVAGLKDDTVYSIAGRSDNEIWIARKYGGVTRLNLQDSGLTPITYTSKNGLAQDTVYTIYAAPDGTVWAGTLNQGLSRFRAEAWHTFTTHDGLPSNMILAITGNSAGDLFVGTPNGVAELKKDRWVNYTAHDGLPPAAVQSLLLDDTGTLWIGTAKGIAFLQSGSVHVPLGAPDALYGDILGIAENNGWLWITTGHHVLRVKSDALLKQSFVEGDYREFGMPEGLPSVEGVKRSRSVVKDDRGRIWFSMNQGISFLQPSAFSRPAFPVTTRFDAVLVDGRPIASTGKVRIPPGRHRLTFRYTGVNVSNPEDLRYRYRLDNVDSAWSEPTALREIDYTNLPPGQFTFHVMGRNPDGVWSEQQTEMPFEIAPEYWQTRWFQVGLLATLLLLGLALYQLRLQQLHHQFNVGLEARVNERTRIARELHDTLLQSLHGLLLRFQAASNLLPARPDEAKNKLDTAIDQASQAIAEGRGAVQGLRSSITVTNDLALAIRTLGEELVVGDTSQNPDFDVAVEGTVHNLHPIVRDEVYRIAAEALRNAFLHSQAKRIEVEIRYDTRQLRLRIRDNGKGIDPQLLGNEGRAGHWGLRGMRERAKLMGGHLDIWSSIQSGTEVELVVPGASAYDTGTAGRHSKKEL